MGVRDETIKGLITELNEQYRLIMGNKFMIAYINELGLPRSDITDMEDLANANSHYDTLGYNLESLYDQLYTTINVINRMEEELLPKMMNESKLRLDRLSDDDKIKFKMTVGNSGDNIKRSRKVLSDLFENIKRVDLEVNGQQSMVIFTREHFKKLDSLFLD
jgi:hypothetical protein